MERIQSKISYAIRTRKICDASERDTADVSVSVSGIAGKEGRVMNPDTNKLEKLHEKKIDKSELTEKLMNMDATVSQIKQGGSLLVRPDGSPVPATWVVFKVGELVDIKGYMFKVGHIGESHILFEPAGE